MLRWQIDTTKGGYSKSNKTMTFCKSVSTFWYYHWLQLKVQWFKWIDDDNI